MRAFMIVLALASGAGSKTFSPLLVQTESAENPMPQVADQEAKSPSDDPWVKAEAALKLLPKFSEVESEIHSQYARLTRATQAAIAPDFKSFDRVQRISRTETLFYWGECVADFDEDIEIVPIPNVAEHASPQTEINDVGRDMRRIAQDYTVVRENLRRHRYPMVEIEPAIKGHEKGWFLIWIASVLAAQGHDLPVDAQFLLTVEARNANWDLGQSINEVLHHLGSRRPRFGDAGGCGGEGENPALLRTIPAGGELWIIKNFAFLLCKESGVDPWNRTECSYWLQTDPDRKINISGNVVYEARWPGGGVHRSRTYLHPGAKDPMIYNFR